MKTGTAKKIRCAIYTRVSTDQGLDQDFNSLDAQSDASEAYIRSQTHAGWTLIRSKYDDGGFSGGNTDRPALQRLLDDVRAGKIDVIVIYKVDRLIVTKRQALKSGRTIGGIPFTRGPLSYLLRNRFYIGEVAYKGEILPGGQTPIISGEMFETVQAKLAEQQNNHVQTRGKTGAPLTGLLFDDAGNRMSPSHTRKDGVRYRYYTSLALLQGRPEQSGTVNRVPAAEAESVIADAIRDHLRLPSEPNSADLIRTYVARAVVRPQQLMVELRQPAGNDTGDDIATGHDELAIAWIKPPSKKRREILCLASQTGTIARPIRADARARLVAAIAQGRRWLGELTSSADASSEQIAARGRCSVRKVNMTISLAFLAPDLVKAAIEGRLPRGIGITRLCDLPAQWSLQRRALGLAPQ